MWETEIVCSACAGTHHLCSEVHPRAFHYACPATGEVVELPFRDPSRMPQPWAEVKGCGPGAVQVHGAEVQGKF